MATALDDFLWFHASRFGDTVQFLKLAHRSGRSIPDLRESQLTDLVCQWYSGQADTLACGEEAPTAVGRYDGVAIVPIRVGLHGGGQRGAVTGPGGGLVEASR